MNLKSLTHREPDEKLLEQEIASSVGVSEQTIMNIRASMDGSFGCGRISDEENIEILNFLSPESSSMVNEVRELSSGLNLLKAVWYVFLRSCEPPQAAIRALSAGTQRISEGNLFHASH